MSWNVQSLALSLVAGLALSGTGCGLDGVRGELVRIEGYEYLLKAPDGHEFLLHADDRTHKDDLQPGDDVQAYVTKDGYAEFIQRLEQ